MAPSKTTVEKALENRQVVCLFCDEAFRTISRLSTHLAACHRFCPLCPLVFEEVGSRPAGLRAAGGEGSDSEGAEGGSRTTSTSKEKKGILSFNVPYFGNEGDLQRHCREAHGGSLLPEGVVNDATFLSLVAHIARGEGWQGAVEAGIEWQGLHQLTKYRLKPKDGRGFTLAIKDTSHTPARTGCPGAKSTPSPPSSLDSDKETPPSTLDPTGPKAVPRTLNGICSPCMVGGLVDPHRLPHIGSPNPPPPATPTPIATQGVWVRVGGSHPSSSSLSSIGSSKAEGCPHRQGAGGEAPSSDPKSVSQCSEGGEGEEDRRKSALLSSALDCYNGKGPSGGFCYGELATERNSVMKDEFSAALKTPKKIAKFQEICAALWEDRMKPREFVGMFDRLVGGQGEEAALLFLNFVDVAQADKRAGLLSSWCQRHEVARLLPGVRCLV